MTNIRDVVDYPYPYFLRMEVFGGYPALQIEEFDYHALRFAKRALVAALDIEKKYDIFLSNYAEFENELFRLTLDSMLDRSREYDDVFELIRLVSLRISNLLSSGRLYIDQLKHDIKSCASNGDEANEYVKKVLSERYDNSRSYRLIEAIRNYSQHRSLPVHSVNLGNSIENIETSGHLYKHTLDVYAERELLRADKKFKSSILHDFDTRIDLKKALRDYVSAISEVHFLVRKNIDHEMVAGRNLIEYWSEQYRQTAGECSKVSLHAIKSEDDGLCEEIALSLEWDKSRQRLLKQNRHLKFLSRHYVTSVSSDACAD